MEKPEIILELEKEIGVECMEVSYEKIMIFLIDEPMYSIDSVGNVIALRINKKNLNLKKIPKTIHDNPFLRKINLANNQIQDISPLSDFTKLKALDLRNNQIRILPEWICDFDIDIHNSENAKDGCINLYNNPIENVPFDVINKGKAAIQHFFNTNTEIANKTSKKQILTSSSYIKSISIENYFSIENIQLHDLQSNKEIYFVGENGVGKTIFLQTLLMCFRFELSNEYIIKHLLDNEQIQSKKGQKFKLSGLDSDNNQTGFEYPNPKGKFTNQNVYAYGVHRNRAGAQLTDNYGYLSLFDKDVYYKTPDDWLKQILLFYYESLINPTDDPKSPLKLETAISFLKQLINIDDDKLVDIKVNAKIVKYFERETELSFEQLSDGFRSVLILATDLLSRLVKDQPEVTKIEDFKAIVLVDEIDLLLHPRWAYKLVKRLRVLFPNIQWFISTHSPIITLGASEDAVFYTLYKEDGKTKVSEPVYGLSGMSANSLITSPLWRLGSFVTAGTSANEINNDDYVFKIIHAAVSERINKLLNYTDNEVIKYVQKLLDNLDVINSNITGVFAKDVTKASKLIDS